MDEDGRMCGHELGEKRLRVPVIADSHGKRLSARELRLNASLPAACNCCSRHEALRAKGRTQQQLERARHRMDSQFAKSRGSRKSDRPRSIQEPVDQPASYESLSVTRCGDEVAFAEPAEDRTRKPVNGALAQRQPRGRRETPGARTPIATLREPQDLWKMFEADAVQTPKCVDSD